MRWGGKSEGEKLKPADRNEAKDWAKKEREREKEEENCCQIIKLWWRRCPVAGNGGKSERAKNGPKLVSRSGMAPSRHDKYIFGVIFSNLVICRVWFAKSEGHNQNDSSSSSSSQRDRSFADRLSSTEARLSALFLHSHCSLHLIFTLTDRNVTPCCCYCSCYCTNNCAPPFLLILLSARGVKWAQPNTKPKKMTAQNFWHSY